MSDRPYLDRLPGGLRRALVGGRWLPFLGAGVSATAQTRDHRRPPAWSALARRLALDIPDAPAVASPIDLISSYADMYGRPHLVERLAELLLVNDVEPGEVHQAFADLPFDVVVTTNVDFLVERAYAQRGRQCTPLIGESQLSVQRRPEATSLLKFHGDLNHPDQLVATEEDYDGFVRRNPLLATYLSWWLLTREPILFGYSLDDPDLREILTLLRERLGRMARPAWAILPADPDGEEPKFARRGIKPIVLDKNPKADRSEILAAFLRELRTEWEREITPRLEARTDATTAELRRIAIAPQLALFVCSRPMLALYRDFVFPSVPRSRLLPIGVDDIRPHDPAMTPMAIDVALAKAAIVVYDESRANPLSLEYVRSRRLGGPVLVVGTNPVPDPVTLVRPAEMAAWPEAFVEPLVNRLTLNSPVVPPGELAAKLNQLQTSARQALEVMDPDSSKHREQQDLLLTCLAMLERHLRDNDEANLPTVIPTGGRMARLREYFGNDFATISEAVGLRHDLVQNLDVDDGLLNSANDRLLTIVRTKLGLPTG